MTPSEATIRRLATRVDAVVFEAAVATWTVAHHHGSPNGDRLAVAIDGETVRGARDGSGRAPHLLSAATHQNPVVLAQRQTPSKTSDIPMVATLLEDLPTAGQRWFSH